MSRSRSAASTLSTILNPFKKKLGFRKSSRGTNALYRAISAEKWDLVVTICENKPYKAEKWHNAVGFFDAHRSSRILPLHQACIFHPTATAIRYIIQAYPLALSAKESGYGRVPLHIACHSNASIECIRELIAHYPAASIIRDLIGRVPLHYALSNGATEEIVEELITAAVETYGDKVNGRREVCSAADFNGWLPIHVACFMGASAKVLSMLVKAYPEGVEMATKKNSTPLSLLRGISISPQKKNEMESILTMQRRDSNVFRARISPIRTDMEKVVRMSDETCSRGVTLVIEEDETSSLSSMENTAATVRTGTTKYYKSFGGGGGGGISGRQLQFGADVCKLDAPPPSSSSSPHVNHHNHAPPPTLSKMGVGTVLTTIHSPSLLPTHDVYGPSSPPNLSIPRLPSWGTSDPNANANPSSPITPTPATTTKRNTNLDFMYLPENNDRAIRRPMPVHHRVQSQASSSGAVTATSISTESSPMNKSSTPVFQPIPSTAFFC